MSLRTLKKNSIELSLNMEKISVPTMVGLVDILKSKNQKKPTFEEIEREVDFDYIRPIYKIANYEIHASSKGMVYRLGLLELKEDLLLAGPSIFGLDIPVQQTAISLSAITSNFLGILPDMESITYTTAINELALEGYIFSLKPVLKLPISNG